ncbi:MAG: hypothetical protein LBM19_01120 [Holosporales bacterium]|jgi:undecaprenyl-diphosphatase|nr:hypothetical protein [Holosporales bacterium]
MNSDILSLGIIQGIFEILPVSSSVNLHFFSKFFNIHECSLSIKIALHIGSLITLLIYFNKEIADIIKGIFSKNKKISDTYLLQLIAGTIPVIVAGSLAWNFVKEFNSLKIMGISCIIFGILLVIFDKLSCVDKPRSQKGHISITKSLIIGMFQSISIFPGISRLGICITAARMLSLDRKNAIRFSLMLAIPSILGALVLGLIENYKVYKYSLLQSETLIGIAVTAVVGLVAILPCVKYMEKHGFLALTIYRILISLLICFM